MCVFTRLPQDLKSREFSFVESQCVVSNCINLVNGNNKIRIHMKAIVLSLNAQHVVVQLISL